MAAEMLLRCPANRFESPVKSSPLVCLSLLSTPSMSGPRKPSSIVTALPESPLDRPTSPERPDSVPPPRSEPRIPEPRLIQEPLPSPNMLPMLPSILLSASSTADDSCLAPSGVDAVLSKAENRAGMAAPIPDLVLSVLSPNSEDILLVKSPPRYPFTKSIRFSEFLDMIPPHSANWLVSDGYIFRRNALVI